MDIGTLFQARNFLNTRTVPKSPMKDINACEDLLLKYADALTITAFRSYCEKNNIVLKDLQDNVISREYIDGVLNGFVEEFVVPKVKYVLALNKTIP